MPHAKFYDLKVNRQRDPLCVDCGRVTFSFLYDGVPEKPRVTVWDGDAVAAEGPVEPVQSHCFTLLWTPEPGRRYRWQITDGENASESAWFETAIDFTAPWVAPEQPAEHPVLVRRFRAGTGPARLYITGLGLYEAYLNGRRVGDALLTPGFTEYQHHVRYQTYDVTELLREDNELRVTLGNGWYKGRFGLQGRANIYGDRFLLAAELRQNGQTLWQSGGEFEVWSSGFLSSGIYDGEFFDATHKPRLLGRAQVVDAQFPVVPQTGPPVRAKQRLTPVLLRTPKGEQVLDFGQNMAGIVEFTCREPYGTKISLQAGEVLQNGCFYRDNLRDARARFDYIADGKTRRVTQHFTYYGFRYMLVEGIGQVDPADFTALALYSDLEPTLFCRTSAPKLDRLLHNALWGQRSNFVDVATDCPQRSERLGWTGDTQVFAPTACYHMDCLAFYEKTLDDLRAEQGLYGGNLPNYAPSVRQETGGGCAVWSDIATILPWTLYTWYGDKGLLSRSYPLMRDYAEFLIRRDRDHGNTRLYHEGGFGDWLAGDGVCDQAFVGGTEVGFISAVYYRHSVGLTAQAARELGREQDAARYSALAEEIRAAILREYFTPTGRFALDTQTAYVLALRYGLYPNRDRTVQALRERFKKDFFKIKSGFAGTPLMLPTLFACGMDDDAYRLLFNEELPGWLYAVNMGATTIWERWNSILPDGSVSGTGMNSLNHYAYGSVCEAVYGDIAGLRPAAPGWKRATFRPRPNYRMREIELRFVSPSGTYAAGWTLLDSGELDVRLTVPQGASAQAVLPGRDAFSVEAGEHRWQYMPEIDYLHPFSRDSYLYDLLRCNAAAETLKRHHPELCAAASGENPEFLTATLDELAHIPMWGTPPDLTAVDRALRTVLPD